MCWPNPTPEEQVCFLRNIQRLLGEGQFVASYKFALLLAIADLAVTKGDDTGAPLDLQTSDIAEKFVEQYWQQCRPFEIGGQTTGFVLQQNTGKQAAVISKIIAAQHAVDGSLFRFRQFDVSGYRALVSEVDQVVRVMPLWKLQTVGAERLDFLYPNVDRGTRITLQPGVAYCLRAFHGLLRDLIQGAWVRFVRKLNTVHLGSVTDVSSFLFDRDRGNVEVYRSLLRDIQRGQCFYCGQQIRAGGDVDHFVPWARYPTDLGHNFVLAHAGCNNSKSDYLAAEDHLGKWQERNRVYCDELVTRFAAAEVVSDLPASIRIARWAYEQTEQAGGQVWVTRDVLRHLGPAWRLMLGV
jgi:hypothetical protein